MDYPAQAAPSAGLRRWADLHCTQSNVFRDDRGSAVLTALRRLCIDVPLQGRWCTLIPPREALIICASDFASRGAALPPAGDAYAGARPAERFASPHEDDSDVRVVALSG